MLFPMTGTLYNSMKSAELEMKWQMKKKDPNYWDSLDERSKQIINLQENAASVRKSNAMSSISAKMESGAELTDEELAYLRENNPQMYQEAMKIKMERQAYEKELEKCRTKEDVERVKTNKMNQMLSYAKAVSSNPNIPEGAKLGELKKIMSHTMALCNEHLKFIKTPRYAKLPTEDELRRKEKERKESTSKAETDSPEKTEIYIEDEEMEKKLHDLIDGIKRPDQDGWDTNPIPGNQENGKNEANPVPGDSFTSGKGTEPGKTPAPAPAPAPIPDGSQTYDAKGTVTFTSDQSRPRLNIKR
ncbi:MAG: hypothetical protein HFG18_08145 [Oscillospiraceae bacterium]|nr:hypothetical protein [Oscillospiraceae bacterium]